MRIVFAGTPEFAAEHLKALLDSPYEIVAVYTQPDRPAGRGQKLMPSAVKALAVAHDIPVFQPQTLRNADAQAELAALKPDLMVVVAYGLILPQVVLDIPRLGCINSHASLLPRWRGAAPIQRAVQAGDAESGVTVMRMEAGLDTGPMLLKVVTPISAEDTGGSLHDRLAALVTRYLLGHGFDVQRVGCGEQAVTTIQCAPLLGNNYLLLLPNDVVCFYASWPASLYCKFVVVPALTSCKKHNVLQVAYYHCTGSRPAISSTSWKWPISAILRRYG